MEKGPAVPADEDVYRAILYPLQWSNHDARPSSAAFDDDKFSVDRAKLCTAAQTAARFQSVLRVCQFNVGQARELGFDTREEIDELYPDNYAHAHVYAPDVSSSQRKKRAKKLACLCVVVQH